MNKPPLHLRNPDTNTFFVPGQGVHPTHTSDQFSNSTEYTHNQHLQTIFQHIFIGAQIFANNITEDTPLLGIYDLVRLLYLIFNHNIQYYTLISIKNSYY